MVLLGVQPFHKVSECSWSRNASTRYQLDTNEQFLTACVMGLTADYSSCSYCHYREELGATTISSRICHAVRRSMVNDVP